MVRGRHKHRCLPDGHGYIYALIDPRAPHTFRYVGKSTIPPRERVSNHCSQQGFRQSQSSARWVKGLWREHMRPWLLILEYRVGLSRGELDAREDHWISECLRRGHPLLNQRKRYSRWGRRLTEDDVSERPQFGDQMALFGGNGDG